MNEKSDHIEKKELLYEGKAKKIFACSRAEFVIIEYKDDATAGNGAKKGSVAGKGAINNRVSNHLMGVLEKAGIPTHFERELGPAETLVKVVKIVPLEVIVRNIAAGSLAKRLGIPEGTPLAKTVIEYCYKDDALGDPLVNEYHIAAMGWATDAELRAIAGYALRINDALSARLKGAGIELIDFKLEFGRTPAGDIILADEISPDTCRFWDAKTKKKLDKDRFRFDLGEVGEAYREVMSRLLGAR